MNADLNTEHNGDMNKYLVIEITYEANYIHINQP